MQNYDSSEINKLATMIHNAGNTCGTHLYAIQEKKTGLLITHRNNIFYTTRKQAREARRSIERKDIKIVKTHFVNVSPWTTAK